MQYTQLGRTDIKVSRICLGTMTWGGQNTEEEAHAQMDYALGQGVNFWDTAELYPFAPTREWWGNTERIIGTWLAKNRQKRDRVVVATKITGAGPMAEPIRGGGDITPATIEKSVQKSLERLQTEYIDLYQFHWPNRGSYHFHQHWEYDPSQQNTEEGLENMRACLQTLGNLVKKGTIRAFGLSNETAWGVMQFARLAEEQGLPRVASIQNEYSLLNRLFDTDLAEVAHHEDVGLLAWSPLAMGMLTGKYLDGKTPAQSRKAYMGRMLRQNPVSDAATRAYVELAHKYGVDPAQFAIAFTLSRPFTTAGIIGATTLEQLQTNIGAAELKLTEEMLQDIGQVYRRFPMPF
jgi:aryl-alcohol dehydrogenase-like predicted oxidoreductase